MKEKIGIGVITCNREDFCSKCIQSIPRDMVDETVVVNDGLPYSDSTYNNIYSIQHKNNTGVGISKNDAIRYLLDKDCTHIFLIEDDIIIKNADIFKKYIESSNISGIKHLMFGYHGPANKEGNQPKARAIIEYPNNVRIALNHHCVGAFCYYNRKGLDKVGLMDEKFLNAFEHVEHTHQFIKAGMLPAFWWFPDIADSCDYLSEQACSEVNSSIRPRSDWQKNIYNAFQYYTSKHGLSPVQTPDTAQEEVVSILKRIRKEHKI